MQAPLSTGMLGQSWRDRDVNADLSAWAAGAVCAKMRAPKNQEMKPMAQSKPIYHPERTGEWRDAMYNNRERVPEFATHLRRWDEQSRAARASGDCELDIAYGSGEREQLDIFRARPDEAGGVGGAGGVGANAKAGAPVLFFIHGGYWRALSKSDHSFVAPAFTRQGACVVVPSYGLCPGTPEAPVTVPGIVLQMVRALEWTWRNIARYGGDPGRITVAGFSAGGHLAAMMAACLWRTHAKDLPADLVKGALAVSGLFELDSMMHTPFLQADLRLTPGQVAQASPAWLPAPAKGRLYVAVGADESEEYQRQAALMQRAWGERRVPLREAQLGRNHFTMMEGLADPQHRVHRLALELLGLG